jgi:hypothetical protein
MDMKNTWLVQLHTLEVPARPRQGVLVLAWELNVPRARWHAALALIRSRRRQSAPGLVSPSRFTYELAVRPEADRAVRTLLPRALTRLGVGALCMCTESCRIVSSSAAEHGRHDPARGVLRTSMATSNCASHEHEDDAL